MSKLIIGTYTNGESHGLYSVPLDFTVPVSVAAEIDNPSYLLYSRKQKKLYVVSESETGKITSYNVSGERLTYKKDMRTKSSGLVHIAADKTGKYLFTASYEDAKIQMTKLSADGDPEEVVFETEHKGSSSNKGRQSCAHAHSVWLTPDQKDLCVCDLGLDKIVVYEIDYKAGRLIERKDRNIDFPAGAGPRHMVFSSDRAFAYVLTELTSQIFIYSWSSENGFAFKQKLDLLDIPDPDSTAAAIRISRDGRFVYASCRGKDIVAVFAVQSGGFLKRIQRVSVNGKHPRDILLAEDDCMLLCACRDTNSVTVFDRDADKGTVQFRTSLEGIPDPIALEII